MSSLAAKKHILQQFIDAANAEKMIDIEANDYTLILSDEQYKPAKTAKLFHADKSRIRLVMGAYGSGKSTLCCADVVHWAMSMPKMPDGVRRSKFAFIRNTYGELETTTLKTWMDWFQDLGHVKTKVKPPYIKHTFNDEHGKIELELIFLALDRPDHIKKLKSLELTGAYLNEASELPAAVLSHIMTRVNRYPSHRVVTGYRYGVIADTNPPPTKHWIYRQFEENPAEGFKIFHQPPGVLKKDGVYIANPDADNIENLSPNYYLDMIKGQSEEFIRVYAMGEYGVIRAGKPVYPEYNDDLHGVNILKPLEGVDIDLAWDFGLTPCVLITQTDAFGRLLVLREICSESMGLTGFIDNLVKPVLKKHYAGFNVNDSVGDPAGSQRAQTDETTCYEVLEQKGIVSHGAETQAPLRRMDSVRQLLNSNVEGKPKILIDKTYCPILRDGFLGLYSFEKIKIGTEEAYKEKPLKNEYSHIHDALQYRALSFYLDNEIQKNQQDDDFDYQMLNDYGQSIVNLG